VSAERANLAAAPVRELVGNRASAGRFDVNREGHFATGAIEGLTIGDSPGFHAVFGGPAKPRNAA
jgi:hypothetical protein